MTTDTGESDIASIIGLVLFARQAPDSASRALTAEVKRAIRPETQQYAAPHLASRMRVARFDDERSEGRRDGIYRAAALTAQYPRIPAISGSAKAAPTFADAATGEPAAESAAELPAAAEAAEAAATRGGRLGQALRQLARRSDNPEAERKSLGAKIQVLPLLGREPAVKIIDGLLARLDNTGIPVDFYDLARTLAYWESGDPVRDLKLRQRISFDFFA